MSNTTALLEESQKLLVPNYPRRPVVMERGEGVFVWDADGKRYLDLFAGFGGCVLGHCHPALVRAAQEQARRLWHVGNSFATEPQLRFAQHLYDKAFPGRAFFCHGGMDANESAVKLARLRGSKASPSRYKTITFNMSFHGRSLAMIAAGSTEAHREGFGPLPPGFVHATGGDFEDLVKHVDEETCAIMFEPIRGEGGMHGYPPDFARRVRQLCDEREITLIFDEVWTGGGRMGKWFGHQFFEDGRGGVVTPDIMTLGKAIGGGLAVGAMWAKPEIADLLTAGKHGSTLGGNAISMAVAAAIFETIEKEGLLEHARKMGEVAKARFAGALPACKVRGEGLFLGLELPEAPKDLAGAALEAGLIINVTQQKVVRLAPGLIITPEPWDEGLEKLIRLIRG